MGLSQGRGAFGVIGLAVKKVQRVQRVQKVQMVVVSPLCGDEIYAVEVLHRTSKSAEVGP